MTTQNQLSLFEIPEEPMLKDISQIPFEKDDRVEIIVGKDPEGFYYVQDFIKKRGVVLKVIEQPKLQYKVIVGDKIARVYHDELKMGWPE